MRQLLANCALRVGGFFTRLSFKLGGGSPLSSVKKKRHDPPIGGELIPDADLSPEAASMRADLSYPHISAVPEPEPPEPLAGSIEERIARSRGDLAGRPKR